MSPPRRSRPWRWTPLALLAVVWCSAGVAWSRPTGITGFSGKQGPICTQCHAGGVAPTVSLDGPRALDAGMTALYTFRITTGAEGTGMNAAVSDGTMGVIVDSGLRVMNNEVTHVAPAAVTGGGGNTYTFAVTAPDYSSKVTLYAAGNAVNLDGTNSGDNASKTKIDIAIQGPPRPPDAGPDGSADAGVDADAAMTRVPEASTRPPSSDGSDRNDASTDDPGGSDDSGCSCVASGAEAPSAAGAMGMALMALTALRRRRRR